jgi:hypothetical protein
MKDVGRSIGEGTNGMNVIGRQFPRGRRADVQEIRHRELPCRIFVVFSADHRNSIGLFHIAAKLCKDFAE